MRIIRLRRLLFALPLLSMLSCSSLRTSVATKSLSATGERLIQAPLVAELDVDSTTKIEGVKSLTKREGKIYRDEAAKDLVMAEALERKGGDVMIEPRFTTTYNKKGYLRTIAVSGYSAKYDSFRQFELRDTLLLDVIYGRERVVAPVSRYVEPVTLEPVVTKGGESVRSVIEGKKSNGYTRSGLVISAGYTLGSGIIEGYLGYQVKRFTTGFYYMNMSCEELDNGNYLNGRSHSFGVYTQFNILNKAFTPYIRANIGPKLISYESVNWGEEHDIVADYGAEFGAQYSPKGRSSFSLGVAIRRAFDIDYDSVQTEIGGGLTFRYNLMIGRGK